MSECPKCGVELGSHFVGEGNLAVCPPKEWVGMTEDEVYRIAVTLEGEHWKKISDAIEAKLKEKNT
jgi:hypothetical protein